MTTQTRERLRSLKWLVAVIVFILALTITWSDVHGTPTSGADRKHQTSQIDDQSTAKSPAVNSEGVSGENDPPASIPEPATLVLLGGGLSAMYLMRRKRRARRTM